MASAYLDHSRPTRKMIEELIVAPTAILSVSIQPTPRSNWARGPPVTKSGDLWMLGEHRLLCSSVLNPAALQVLVVRARLPARTTFPHRRLGRGPTRRSERSIMTKQSRS